MTSQNSTPVWFITGCSTGFGREIARQALDRGFRVAVTARHAQQVADLVGDSSQALAIELDVTIPSQIEKAVAQAQQHFGRIDVLVNNAGIGYFGAIEESDDAEVRRMFEINFWGLANMTRAVLPGMRAQRGGVIVNLSSVGGLRGGPSVGYYNATKFAVEGFSEALSKEVAPLGIKVLLVEPSGFRTDWAGRSANEATTHIADYDDTAGLRRKGIREHSGKQAGDPVRAATAIIDTVALPQPPLRLPLGVAALEGGREKIASMAHDFDACERVAAEADFPEQ